MKLFILTLSILLIFLQYHLWFGKNGIIEYRQVSADIVTQKEVNHKLVLRNQKIFTEIDDLEQGLDAIEERARHELGMMKKGETFYRIIDDSSS